MLKASLMYPTTRIFRKGSISHPVLAAIAGGAVIIAAGYTVLSNGRSVTGSPQANSAAFNPVAAGSRPAASGASTGAKSNPAKISISKTALSKAPSVKPGKLQARKNSSTPSALPAAPEVVQESSAKKSGAGPVKAAAKPALKTTKIVAAAKPSRAVAKTKVSRNSRPRLAAAPAAAREATGATVGDWPEYRGRFRDGISRETGWLKGNEAKLVWQANIGTGFSSISVSRGRAYTMGNNGGQDIVWCLDAATGKVLWKHSYACDLFANSHEGGPSATPTVDGNLVFTYSKKGHLHALDAQSGRVVWSKNIPEDYGGSIPQWGVGSSPVVHDDKLIVVAGAPGACVIAFNKNNGKVVWKAGNDGPSYAAPLIFRLKDVPYLAVFNAAGIVFHNLKDGRELWRHAWKTSYEVNAAMPIIEGDRVFVSSGYNTGCALFQSSKDDALVWQNRNMSNHFNSSVLWNGHIYGFDESELACLNWNTGRKMWSQGRLGKGSLLVADGKLVILSERGELVIAEASPQGYREISRSQILGGKCWTVPALANGRIYARNADGNLVCVKFG